MKTEQYFRRALRAFREENQTLEKFLAVLVGIKGMDEPVSASSLLAVLKAENTEDPLPQEIYESISHWIKINSDVVGSISNQKSNIVNIPSPKHPANINREFRKHKARVLNNRYVLIKVIDSSFIGTVYKAIDLRKQEADIPEPYVAIKILKRTFRAHQDWLTTYYNEVQKRQWLTHPNITKVLGLDRDASTVFIIMEYILGESLAHALNFDDLRQDFIQKGRLLPIINGMGEALAFAHKRGIIHGNFKPSKVLLTKDDEVKVFDFSIECALSDIDAADPTLEMDSPLIETRIYASPEVLEYDTPDPRDDVYALACTTYELLTGLHPFNREISTVARNAGMKVKLHNGMERRQWKALRHALAFERNKRTPDVAQFLTEFNGSRSARTKSWLRYAAGIAAIATATGIALNYHLSKLEQAQIAQQNTGNEQTPIPFSNSDSTTPSLAHSDTPETENSPSPEKIVEIDAVKHPTNTDEVLATNEIPAPNIQPPQDSETPIQNLPAGNDDSSLQTSPDMMETEEAANTVDSAISENVPQDQAEKGSMQATAVPAEEDQPDQASMTMAHDANTLETTQQATIDELMAQAEQQRAQRQLTMPPGDNALETYREIVALDPDYEPALQSIEDIKLSYKTLSQYSYHKGDLQRAEIQLKKAIAIDPEDTSLKKDLASLQKALKADQAARDNDRKITALLDKSRQQMAEQRLTQPPGNNAWESLSKIIQIDPENKKAHEGLDTLAKKLELKALAEQRTGDLNAALALADEGLLVQPNDAGLLTLRSELNYQLKLKSRALLAEKRAMDSNIVENEATDAHKMPPQQEAEKPKPRRFRAGGTF